MMSYWKHPDILMPDTRELLVPATDPSRWPNLGASPAQIMMYLDTVAWLPDDILVKLDRATMGTSLEARIPLLDHRVIEFAWRLPLSIRMGWNGTKRPLRQLLDRYVPRQLMDRPKRGFHMPVADWLRGPLRDWAEALLDERHLADSGLDPRPVREKWTEHLSGTTRWDYHLWTVLMYSAWVDSTTQTFHPAAA
jgi:asparagine synthase (glutamine-hydrolysing)